MKKLLTIAALLLLCSATGNAQQLNGYFADSTDGINYWLTSTYGSPVNVQLIAVNEQTREQRSTTVTVPAYGSVYFGTNYGWAWMPGEIMYVRNAAGQTIFRHVNTLAGNRRNGRNPSFGNSEAGKYNGRKCSKCDCSGCVAGNWDPFKCSKCGHACSDHTK